jgi:diaminohydroxyphosphoribosylaminopyrimidine deaminase/5-amino-6-(5-phosphoribosylamino)uracil reductase
VDAGVGRVVVAVLDPFPKVAGRSVERLRAAGIQVDLAEGAVAAAAYEMNIGFFSRVTRGRPWVRVKVAASMDGHTALPDGRSQWITGEAARADGHAWRKRAGAILSGSGTVVADNPRLDVRLVTTELQPLRVIVDGALRCPPTSRVFHPPGQVWLATAQADKHEAAAFEAQGARLLYLPDPQDASRVQLSALLDLLGREGINEVHVEAGAGLNGALASSALVDEWLIYLAPMWLGEGRPMLELPAPPELSAAQRMAIHQLRLVGQDVRLQLRPRQRRKS